ncbi:hypothetical protein [Pseudomonas fluorescens]|uniref:hypothetical protein n=1 Tax=Pseudomonas fluorescens TaxID=294 RepID=UPI00259BDFC7|nr:hypothetical protein [Pseudomonas fluorescens]WJK11935.1 hypothetical protein QR290_11540 [Pseudomonas fluorescens]
MTANSSNASVAAPPPPTIQENPSTFLLDPQNVRNTLTVEVTDPSLQPGDSVSVMFTGDPATGSNGSHTTSAVSAGTVRPMHIRLPFTLTTFNLGRTVIVTYTITRGNAAPVTSDPLVMYVLTLAQRDLPRALITEADQLGEGRFLNLDGLSSFTLRIDAWTLSTRGQFLWLRLLGINADNSVFDRPYWGPPGNVIADEFNRFGYYETPHPATDLRSLKHGSVLSLILMVGLQGSQDPSFAQPFAHRNYIVLTDPTSAPRIERIVDPDGREVADQGETLSTRVTLFGVATEPVIVFDGETRLGTAPVIAGAWEYLAAGLTTGLHVFTGRYAAGGVSRSWTINVLENREVRIKESTGNTHLNPSASINTLTFVLDYPSQPADLVSLRWIAAPGTPAAGSYTSLPVAVGATPRELTAPVSLVAFSIGKTVEATASYVRGGAPAVQLQPLALSVLPISSNLLISPVIDEAKDTLELDKKDIVAGANLTFGNWIHIARGQRLELTLMGFTANGTENNRSLWTPDRNSVHQAWVTNPGYTFRLPADYLLSLGVGTLVSILFTVRTDQVPSSTAVTVFEPRRYTIVDTR